MKNKKKELKSRGKELGEKIAEIATTAALLAVAKVIDEYLEKVQGKKEICHEK